MSSGVPSYRVRLDSPNRHVCRRILVVCPTSLVSNWDKEISKWVGNRIKSIAIAESTRDKACWGARIARSPPGHSSPRALPGHPRYQHVYVVPRGKLAALGGGHCHTPPILPLNSQYSVLIISYETFRIHAKLFHSRPDSCDLLICDEAHRCVICVYYNGWLTSLYPSPLSTTSDLRMTRLLRTRLWPASRVDAAFFCLARRCRFGSLPCCCPSTLLHYAPHCTQNDLGEFFAMVDFTNPGVLGDAAGFQ